MLPQYARTHPFLNFFIMQAVLAFILGVALLFLVPLPIGLTCIAVAVLFILATRRSTARRYLVADHYRVPRAPRLSEFLIRHRRRLWLINFGGVVLIVLAFNPVGARWWEWLALAVLCGLISPLLSAALKMHLKFTLDSQFRIVIFRRYEDELSLRHKAVVLPICGFYGQLLLFEDDKLSGAWEGGRLRMDQWVFAELYQPLAADRETEAWRSLVREQLSYADFVLFDWSAEITENMIWEMERAVEFVPLERIMVLQSQDNDQAKAVLEEMGLGASLGHRLSVAPLNGLGEALFIFQLTAVMANLRPQPRPPGHLADALIARR